MIMEKRKHEVVLNRPLVIGFSILELSKLHMFKFHYGCILPTFGFDRARLCYTDTDSLVYELTARSDSSESLFSELRAMQQSKRCFELKGLPAQHPLRLQPMPLSNTHEFGLGAMKDEMAGKDILEFVALRPKMYSVLKVEEEIIEQRINEEGKKEYLVKRATGGKTGNDWRSEEDLKNERELSKRKGVPGSVVFRHEDYLLLHQEGGKKSAEFYKFQKDKQLSMHTIKQQKIGLSTCDDKSYWLNNDECVRYGHYRIM